MGVDPFLIAPTLVLAIAQRLGSVLCPHAGKKIMVEGAVKARIDDHFKDVPEQFRKEIKIPESVYELAPASDCPTGTRGRMAVFEVITMNRELEAVILENPSEDKIMEVARKQGMFTMQEDAMLKVLDGKFALSEIDKI